MKFFTAIKDDQPEVYVSIPGAKGVCSLHEAGFGFVDMNDVVCHMTDDDKEKLKSYIEKNPDKAVSMDTLTLCAPIIAPLQDVVCLGINYDEHAKEASKFSTEAFTKDKPYTIYFSKRVNRATATNESIPSYEGLVDSLDYECELGVILKKDAKNVKAADAADYIFGYTIINDISARNLQTRHKQWYLGKSLDGFTPMGPCIVTPDEIGDAAALDIKSYVNGELRQNSNTRYMIQTIGGAIEELSQGMTLKAGTIIATGTPAGVGMGMNPPTFLKHGDTIICEIQNIGQLVNSID